MPVDIQTILVATDLSEASAPATAYAFSLARALNARLYIIYVVPEDDVRMLTAIRGYLQSEVTPAALVETFYTEADKRLTTLVDEAHATDLLPERLIVTGQPAVAIMNGAVAKQAQLIIIGTTRTPWGDTLLHGKCRRAGAARGIVCRTGGTSNDGECGTLLMVTRCALSGQFVTMLLLCRQPSRHQRHRPETWDTRCS